MPGKRTARVVVDLGMTVLLLLLMAYSLIGEEAHEWLGAAMLLLFVLHHIWLPGAETWQKAVIPHSGWCKLWWPACFW